MHNDVVATATAMKDGKKIIGLSCNKSAKNELLYYIM